MDWLINQDVSARTERTVNAQPLFIFDKSNQVLFKKGGLKNVDQKDKGSITLNFTLNRKPEEKEKMEPEMAPRGWWKHGRSVSQQSSVLFISQRGLTRDYR